MKKEITLRCLILITCLLVACKSSPEKETKAADSTISKPILDKRVSLVTLIANPERYDQRQVRVKGFLNLEFEGNAIYLHKDDYDLGIDKNGVWVDLDSAKIDTTHYRSCNKQYVILEGTFQMNNQGHMGGYSGSITKVTRIDLLSKTK